MGEASPAPAVPSGVVMGSVSQGDGASTLSGGCAGGRALGSRVGDVETVGKGPGPAGLRTAPFGRGDGGGSGGESRSCAPGPSPALDRAFHGARRRGGRQGSVRGARTELPRGFRRGAGRTRPPSGRNGAGRAGPRRIARGSRGVNTTGNGPWASAEPRPWGGLPAAGARATRFLGREGWAGPRCGSGDRRSLRCSAGACEPSVLGLSAA